MGSGDDDLASGEIVKFGRTGGINTSNLLTLLIVDGEEATKAGVSSFSAVVEVGSPQIKSARDGG